MHQVVEQSDSPVTRGMVLKVAHLVQIVEES
jgi:ribosomal protein L30/L7E